MAPNYNNSPYAFITVEDLNYATCIPSENENALANWQEFYDGDNLLFKYFRSTSEEQSDDWWKYSAITEGDEPPLYSNIPYPEFVNQFFTDPALVSPYVPAKTDEDGNNVNGAINYISMIPNPVETPYVNSGDPGGDIQDIPNQYTSWWKNEQFPNRTVPLQWSAIFANGDANGVPDGKKVFPLVEAWELIGVGSSQVTYLRIDGPNSDPIQQVGDFENTLIDEQKKWGTTRYRQIRKH